MGNIKFSRIILEYKAVNIRAANVGDVLWNPSVGLMIVHEIGKTYYGRTALKCLNQSGYMTNITFFHIADSIEERQVVCIPEHKLVIDDIDKVLEILDAASRKKTLRTISTRLKNKFIGLRNSKHEEINNSDTQDVINNLDR